MWPIIFVSVGGGIGAALRYSLSSFIAYKWVSIFPLSTLLINVSGSFAVAYLMAKGFETGALPNNWRLFLIVGIGGGYTTFSSFSFETIELLRQGFYTLFICNALGNLFLCLMATIVGIVLAKI